MDVCGEPPDRRLAQQPGLAQELLGDLSHGTMRTIHLIVQRAHGDVGKQTGQFGEGLPQGRVGLKTIAPDGQGTILRREILLVIPENQHIQHRQLAIGRIPGHHAHLSLFECLVQQAEVHGLGRSQDGKLIGLQ